MNASLPYIAVRHILGKNVTATTNTHAAREQLGGLIIFRAFQVLLNQDRLFALPRIVRSSFYRCEMVPADSRNVGKHGPPDGLVALRSLMSVRPGCRREQPAVPCRAEARSGRSAATEFAGGSRGNGGSNTTVAVVAGPTQLSVCWRL
jgi:hypothetical protein